MMLLLIGIPFCRPFMTIGGIILVVNWFIEGKFLEKINAIKNNRFLFISLLIFLVYVVWMIFTENRSEGWKSVWMKTPLLFLPIIFATTKPLTRFEFHNLLKVYLLGLLISTVYGFSMYQIHELADKREMAIFISYIRFEMNLCFSVFVILYLIINDESQKWQKYILVGLLLWLLFLIFYIGALTAIIILMLVFLLFVIKKLFENKNKVYRIFLPLLFVGISTVGIIYTYVLVKQYYAVDVSQDKTDSLTIDGNPYTHENGIIENGHYVNAYVCKKELEKAWNERSKINFNDYDVNKQHKIEPTLIRYLNSKGLRKDRIGVAHLSDEDIHYVENGIANVVYLNRLGFKSRLYGLLWELSDYKTTGSVFGYTMPQRFDLWRNSLSLIKNNILTGVGTGDVKKEFVNQLQQSKSSLKDTGKLSHNQFLLFLIQFGLIGFLIILFSLIYPIIASGKYKYDLFFVFICILFCEK